MATPAYDVGDRVRFHATFRDLNGQPANPTTVTAMYMTPSGVTGTVAVAHDGLGAYHFDIDVTESGTWHVRVQGSGAVVAASEERFIARETGFE